MNKPGAVAYAVLGSIPQAFAYVVTPVVVAGRGARHGWLNGRPSWMNCAGLIPVGAGVAVIGWAVGSHYREVPEDWRVTIIPEYLVSRGAYVRSRNPMYVAGALVFTGWALFFGNVRVAVVGATVFTLIATVGVPFEERLMSKRFGDAYEAYRADVPRWIDLRTRRTRV